MIVCVTIGNWIGLAAVGTTMAIAVAGGVYRLGRMDERLKDIVRRLDRVERKQDRSGRPGNNR